MPRIILTAFDYDCCFLQGCHLDFIDHPVALSNLFFSHVARIITSHLEAGCCCDYTEAQIYHSVASLRQAADIDLWNMFYYDNGSIVTALEKAQLLLASYLPETCTISPLALLTADIFPETWDTTVTEYRPGAYLEKYRYQFPEPEIVAFFENIKRRSIGSRTKSDEYQHWLRRVILSKLLEKSLLTAETLFPYIDHSKFFTLWLKMHEMARLHPGEEISILFFDDMLHYGKNLLELFLDHPELIPKGITLY